MVHTVPLLAALLLLPTCTVPNPDYIPPGGDPCTMHGQCQSSVCLPDRFCASGLDVAYVSSTGNGDSCNQSAPCNSIEKAMATGRPYLKMLGTIIAKDTVQIADRKWTLFGESGAKLTRENPGPVIRVDGSSQVNISDLEISGATGSSGFAIWLASNQSSVSLRGVTIGNNSNSGLLLDSGGVATITDSTITSNAGDGITTQGGSITLARSIIRANRGRGIDADHCTINIAQSTIDSNADLGLRADNSMVNVKQSIVDTNAGGGIKILFPTQFNIENNFIVRNGTETASVGGIEIQAGSATTQGFRFNTIVDNRKRIEQSRSGGVICTGRVAAPHNLIFRNTGGDAAKPQTTGDCLYGTSLVTAPADPGFRSATDYHLTSATPADTIRNAVDCSGDVDIDGDKRPHGAACDLGADEFR